MWRSVAIGVVVAGLLAGCSWNGGGSASSVLDTKSVHRSGLTFDYAVVTCDQVIGRPKPPFADGYRRVLGVISVPPAFIPQVVRVSGQGWPYWEKSGIAVRAGRAPVTVTVPQSWRNRAAITWGNGKPAVSQIRFAPCPSPAAVWNAYAGGFFLHTHGACVPLVFQVWQRAQRVRFGIGQRCR
jgi:hypothetical protein